MKAPPTFDLISPTNKEPVAASPAPMPRTELLQEGAPFMTRIESAPIPASALDLDWPTPPPNTVMAPPPPLVSIPPTPTLLSMVDVMPPALPMAVPLPSTGNLSIGNFARGDAPTGNLPTSGLVEGAAPTFASVPPIGNRGTMVISTEDMKKSLTAKGKLVGWLVSYAKNPDGEDFKLYAGYNRLGANPACDIVVDDDTVSGSHAIIVFRDGRFLIKDDLSRNGTFVNNKEVTEAHPLQSYDQVRLGNTSMTFVAAQKG